MYCETSQQREAVKAYIDLKKDYYESGDLLATPENGFDYPYSIGSNIVKVVITHTYTYEDIIEPYLLAAKEAVESRVLITAAILLVSIIVVFFAMKSYAIKNIYDIGVYRAIGIKKTSIAFVYALETFVISLQTTLVGGALCYIVTNIIAGIPLIDVSIAISFPMFIYVTFGLIAINVIVGVLPVALYMRLTPSQILSKYDI